MCEFCNDIESVSDIRDIEDHCLSSGILFDKSDGKYWLHTCRCGYDYGDALTLSLEMDEMWKLGLKDKYHTRLLREGKIKEDFEMPETIIPDIYGTIEKKPDGTLYTTKAQRTGCSMCGFGIHMEKRPHRFDLLYESNQKECPSIFDTAEEIKEKYGIRAVRPLAPKTMERIARGLKKFVLENPEPFIIQCNHGGERRPQDIREPMPTITGKHGYGVVEPYLVQIGQTGFTADRSRDVREPLTTIVSKNEHCLIEPKLQMVGDGAGFPIDRMRYPAYCDPEEMDKLPFADPELEKEIQEQLQAPFMGTNTTNHPGGSCEDPIHTITTGNQQCLISPTLIQYHGETSDNEVRGQAIENPIMTVDGSNRYGLVTSFLSKFYGTSTGQSVNEPLHTITAGDGHFGEVRAFLIKYYGQGIGQEVNDPLDTIPTHDRFGLVTIAGVDYQIVDIGLRMLEPKELYGCQGFPDDYIIDHDYTGKTYPRSEQVRRCGNAVCPPIPAALVRANLPEMCKCERTGNMKIETEQTGQLRFA